MFYVWVRMGCFIGSSTPLWMMKCSECKRLLKDRSGKKLQLTTHDGQIIHYSCKKRLNRRANQLSSVLRKLAHIHTQSKQDQLSSFWIGNIVVVDINYS